MDQKRINFHLKDLDVELALKHSPSFQYHFEIEYLGKEITSENKIKEYLKRVCEKLGIVPLTEEELAEKIQEIKKGLNWISKK